MAILNNLIVHGSSRFLNIAQFNALKTNTIGADKGVFNKLIATDATFDSLDVEDLTAQNATVVGLLDVQGDMHTNSWSNSNIATIDGSFYITPTAVSADGADVTASGYTPTGTITYSNTNYTQMTITGTFDTSQLTLDSTSAIAWPANSYVIITGDVLVGTEWYPLGTIRGKLYAQVAANTSSKTFTIVPIGTQIISGESGNVSLTDGNGHKPSTLETIRSAGATLNSLKLRKVKISMTSRGNGNDQYALGIYMTAMGGNKKTFLDIYGGSNKNGVDISSTISGTTYQSGAFAKPTVRIGNLLGLPSFTLPNNTSVTPIGWGIYTNNGFFSGTIVSTQGKIGNFTLGTAIYGAASGAGPSSISATTAGTYLGTDGFRSNKSGDTTKYVQITDGIITAKGADITGTVNATSFAANYTNGSVTYNTLLDGNGLVVTDGTNILSKFGAISTIGRDSGNNYNINIDSSGINLRYNTNILNRIDSSGMTLYDGNGVANSNILANFNTNGAQIGQSSGAHSVIDANGQRFYASDGTTQLANIGYGEGTDSSGGEDDAPYYTLGRRSTITPTVGNYSVVEGNWCTASAFCSHAEGSLCYATGYCSHAEGNNTISRGDNSHAEGDGTTASALTSHAEGSRTTASALASHAEGSRTTAKGMYSHAQNLFTVATEESQTVIGKYNSAIRSGSGTTADPYTYSDAGYYAFIIGNGTDDATADRSNALTVDWNGNVIGQAMAGIIQMYAGAATQTITDGIATVTGAPNGWLICDGSELLKSEYPELAAVLENTWGTPSSSDYFKLPDLRGRAPIGAGTGTGLTARVLGGILGNQNLQAHTHTLNSHTHGTGDSTANAFNIQQGSKMGRRQVGSGGTNRGYQWTTDSTSAYDAVTHRSSTGGPSTNTSGSTGAGDSGNMQPSAVVNFIICTGKTS